MCFSDHASSIRVICIPHLISSSMSQSSPVATDLRVEKCNSAMKRLKVSSSQKSMEGRKIQDTLNQG